MSEEIDYDSKILEEVRSKMPLFLQNHPIFTILTGFVFSMLILGIPSFLCLFKAYNVPLSDLFKGKAEETTDVDKKVAKEEKDIPKKESKKSKQAKKSD